MIKEGIRRSRTKFRTSTPIFRTSILRSSLFHSSVFHSSLLIFLLSILVAATPKHDYHVSVTQMQYSVEARAWEVSIRIFTDDLEKALGSSQGNKKFSIKNGDDNDPFVSGYIQKHFLLFNEQKKALPLRYVGKEQEEDATWIYLEIPFQMPATGYRLQNSILTEIFDDQVNMTNILMPSGKKTYLFKKGQLIRSL